MSDKLWKLKTPNHDIDQPDIADLLDFSSTLHEWQDLYPTGLPIFAIHIGCGTLDDLNTPIYTIPKYFVGLPSNISPRVSGLSLAQLKQIFQK